MPSEKAEALYHEGLDLASEAENTGDKRKFHDAASLIMLAINSASEPYPDAEAALASIYLRYLKDIRSGWKYVKAALEHDPNHFGAQSLRVFVAYAEFTSGTSATGFVLSREGNLNSQVRKLREIFQYHCAAGMYAARFLRDARSLMNTADMFAERSDIKHMGKDVYRLVTSVSTDKIICENDDECKQVTRLQAIAAGRAQL